MTDAALAAITVEIARLREELPEIPRAAVLVLVGDKAYLSVKAADEDDAKGYLANGLLEAFLRGGLVTQREVDEA
jgi:lipid II:glycine glycyltransferase (peptidoglycan interpeptide bridge formation enzyme)